MAKVTVILDLKHPRKDATCTVYIFTSVKSVPIWFNTKVSILPVNWDNEKQCIRGSSKTIKDDNLLIGNCRARISDIFVKYRLKFEELTPALLRKEYANPTADIDFYAFWEMEMKSKKDFVSPNTIAQHESVLAKLKRFQPKCAFSELDKDFLIEYQRYCLTKVKHKFDSTKKGNNQNTINKNLKVIKVYTQIALEREKLKKNPFENLKIKAQHVDIVFLTQDELNVLVKKYKKANFAVKYQETLRRYLFSCFTGIRISDSLALTYDNILENTLILKPQKTKELNKIIRVPLTNFAKVLLNDCIDKTGLVFPFKTEQAINRELKDIMDDCGINKDVSFHSSRHTFATMFYRLTHDIVALQKLLGHCDVKQTMVYTHVVISDIEKEMKSFDKIWK